MIDCVELEVNDKKIPGILEYSIESDLFAAADAFEITLPDARGVKAGWPVRLYVNGQLELTGVVDRLAVRGEKSGKQVTVSGRDLMGLLVDRYVEEFMTLENYTLKQLAEKLMADIPYINTKEINYGKGDRTRAAPLSMLEEDFLYQQLTPGDTVFDTLQRYATGLGMLFFCLPDGTFVFGRPQTGGPARFNVVNRAGDRRHNVISYEYEDDISKRYSRAVVISQGQAYGELDYDDVTLVGQAEDETFPFDKPFVAESAHFDRDLTAYARMLLDRFNFDGFSLQYTTFGHSQRGRNYAVNAVCGVEDAELDIHGDYLIHGRTFRLNKEEGALTELRLSKLGVLPV